MLVYTWIIFGTVCGVAAHFVMGKERGYDMFGEILVGISGASVTGTVLPILLGIRTGSVDTLSDVGLLCSISGAVISLTTLVLLTPRLSR